MKNEPDLKKEKHMTLVQRMSKVIKDVDYPKSPEINRIIPPTPAKKVEFILNSLYVPESKNLEINKPKHSIQRSSSLSRNLSRTSTIFYKGALSLLAKWKHNHSNQDSEMYEKPEMDTFVKYVISITSLDHENSNDEEFKNINGFAKFDILSARTIDEVEYLVSLENKMIQEVKELHCNDNDYDIMTHMTNQNVRKQNIEFSALDNLDLYQTVNTIAKSVISLSNTLQKSNDSHLMRGSSNKNSNNTEAFPYLSPSFDRRKIKSTTAAILNTSNSGLVNPNFDQDSVTGPQRLIFLDGDGTTAHGVSNDQQPNGSPLKHLLPNGTESSDPVDYYRVESRISSVTYDSELSATSPGLSNALSERSEESTPGLVRELVPQMSKGLSKKESVDNLREFTFEDEDEKENSESSDQLNDDMISVSLSQNGDTDSLLEDTDEVKPLHSIEIENNNSDFISPLPSTKKMAMRPASGRISIMKRRTVHTPLSDGISSIKSPMRKSLSLLKDNDFLQKDNALFENELKLTKLEEVINRNSYTPSVSTSRLFNSVHNSPKKIKIDEGGRIRLSIAPSMNSIQSEGSFSSSMSISTQSPLRHKVLNNLREEFQNDKVHRSSLAESNNGNKYFFSPDNDSINAASPEKDMEELKNKFLQSSSNSPSKTEISSARDVTTETDIAVMQANMKKDLNPTNLKDIADMPDDSIHDDPVNVAMLKLEGKYSKEETQLKMQSSPNVSTVSKEVGLLNLEQIVSMPRTPGEKRRSLLIERRRKTIMTIPFTPEPQDVQTIDSRDVLGESEMTKLQNLMKSYSIEDPNLEITNSQHHIPFILMYDSKSVAEQLTLIEKELLKEIDWKDLLDLNIEYGGPMVTSWLQLLIENESLSGIDLMVARFNLTVTWIVSEISLTQDIKMRRNTIQRFIHVAEHCRKFQNYNTLMAIVLALNSTTVQKMIDAWRLIEPGDLLTWEELKKICNLDGNYNAIRHLLSEIDPLAGCIPFVAIYLSDLAINSEKKSWIKENKIINYNKFDMNVQIVKHFIQLSQWSKFYKVKPDHELLSKCVYISALTDDEIERLNNGLNL